MIRDNLKKLFSNNNNTEHDETNFIEDIINKVVQKKNQIQNVTYFFKNEIVEKIHGEIRLLKYLIITIAITSTIAALTGTYLCSTSIFYQIRKKSIKNSKRDKHLNKLADQIEMTKLTN